MDKIRCNHCARRLESKNGIVREDYIEIQKAWGYFSKNDGITQEFVICEQCAQKLVNSFLIPVKEYDTKELI